jgi:hypothetical protein
LVLCDCWFVELIGSTSRGNGKWDQFKANQSEFGVEMGFEVSRYTSKVDTSDEFCRKHAGHADRIAKKIEKHGSFSGFDGEEAWGSKLGPKPKYVDESEEAIFSAVESGSRKKETVEIDSSKDWRQTSRVDGLSMHASASGSSISSGEGQAKKTRKKHRKGRDRERSGKKVQEEKKQSPTEKSPSANASTPLSSETDVEQKLISQMGALSGKGTVSPVLKKGDGMFLRSSISSFQEILDGKPGLDDTEGESAQKVELDPSSKKEDVDGVVMAAVEKEKEVEDPSKGVEMESIEEEVVSEEETKSTEKEEQDSSSEKTQETQTEPPPAAPAKFEFVPDASLPKLVLAAPRAVPSGGAGGYGGGYGAPASSWRVPPHSRGSGGGGSHSRYPRGGGGYNVWLSSFPFHSTSLQEADDVFIHGTKQYKMMV